MLDKIKIYSEKNEILITKEVLKQQSSADKQSISLQFESTISEARKRLAIGQQKIASEDIQRAFDELLTYLQITDDKLELLLADLDVQIEQETIIKTTIEYVPIEAPVTNTNGDNGTNSNQIEPSSCASRAELCSAQVDCCIQTPKLYCQFTTGSSVTKRCLTTQN